MMPTSAAKDAERRWRCYLLLGRIYLACDGDPTQLVDFDELAEREGMDPFEAAELLRQLVADRSVAMVGRAVTLTPRGAEIIEERGSGDW
jgi:hypothetical protein